MQWQYNEWQGDERYNDRNSAELEALRAIAEQLERLNDNMENQENKKVWQVTD